MATIDPHPPTGRKSTPQMVLEAHSTFSFHSPDDKSSRWVLTGHPDVPSYYLHDSSLLRRQQTGWGIKNADESIALTPSEAESPCGKLTLPELHAKVRQFYGGVEEVVSAGGGFGSDGDGWPGWYRAWLEFFIEGNHHFGYVHAWVGAVFENGKVFREQVFTPTGFSQSLTETKANYCDSYIVRGGAGDDDDDEQEEEAKGGQADDLYIMNAPWLHPRRIWDVSSNKVIPTSWLLTGSPDDPHGFYPISTTIQPVSYAGVSPEETAYALSAVNNHQWHIPLPKDVTVEGLREELLRIGGFRYAWIDVFCIRQGIPPGLSLDFGGRGAEKESIRLDELRTDVPTAGYVFRHSEKVIVWFCGLGRKFVPPSRPGIDQARKDIGGAEAEGKGDEKSMNRCPWKGERAWLNRARMLSETKHPEDIIIGGLSPGDGGSDNPRQVLLPDTASTLYSTLTDLSIFTPLKLYPNVETDTAEPLHLTNILSELRTRHASTPADKVFALQTIFCPNLPRVPVYLPDEPVESAWDRLVRSRRSIPREGCGFMGGLLEWPCRGRGGRGGGAWGGWWPTWGMLMGEGEGDWEQGSGDGLAEENSLPLRIPKGHLLESASLYTNIRITNPTSLTSTTPLTHPPESGAKTEEYIYTASSTTDTSPIFLKPISTTTPHPPSPNLPNPNSNPTNRPPLPTFSPTKTYILVDITPSPSPFLPFSDLHFQRRRTILICTLLNNTDERPGRIEEKLWLYKVGALVWESDGKGRLPWEVEWEVDEGGEGGEGGEEVDGAKEAGRGKKAKAWVI